MSFDPANLPTKSTPEQCDWLAERDRECRERFGTPLLVKRAGPPLSIADLLNGPQWITPPRTARLNGSGRQVPLSES